MARASYIRWDKDDDFNSANPLKQPGNIAEKQQISLFIVFGMSQQEHESTI